MWTREILKNSAKNVLRVSYWKAFLVSLILIFAFVLVIGGMIGNFLTGIWNSRDKGEYLACWHYLWVHSL